jgi:hypothetical protein
MKSEVLTLGSARVSRAAFAVPPFFTFNCDHPRRQGPEMFTFTTQLLPFTKFTPKKNFPTNLQTISSPSTNTFSLQKNTFSLREIRTSRNSFRPCRSRLLSQTRAIPAHSLHLGDLCDPVVYSSLRAPKTYKSCIASLDPISDPIVPRFFALYRQIEILCKSKTAPIAVRLIRPLIMLSAPRSQCVLIRVNLWFPKKLTSIVSPSAIPFRTLLYRGFSICTANSKLFVSRSSHIGPLS